MEISANRLNPIAVLGPLGTEMQELHDTFEIVSGGSTLYTRDLLYFRGQRLFGGYGDQRPAIEHKELQEDHHRNHKNEGSHHLDTAARREGASLASSFTRRNAYAHAAGKIQASIDVKY